MQVLTNLGEVRSYLVSKPVHVMLHDQNSKSSIVFMVLCKSCAIVFFHKRIYELCLYDFLYKCHCRIARREQMTKQLVEVNCELVIAPCGSVLEEMGLLAPCPVVAVCAKRHATAVIINRSTTAIGINRKTAVHIC